MYRIAIVDDEREAIESLRTNIERLSGEISEELKVESFESGEDFLKSYDGSYDLICLDIDMGNLSGIDVAREIRKTDGKVCLIFVTNMAQMAIRGYEVRAFDFILKPVEYYSLSMKLKSALSVIGLKKPKNLLISVSGAVQRISTDDLKFVEVNGHYLYYHTKEGVFKQKASLKELEEKIAGPAFKRCNNCYLVNLKYVERVEKDDICIAGERLKMSRPKKKEFLNALANYMGGIIS